MNKTPFADRIDNFLYFHSPTKCIPIHQDDAELAAKKYFNTWHLPFRVLGTNYKWGGSRDNG